MPSSSAASSSSIDLDLYHPEALSDDENVFVLQPDNNLWLTPSAPSSSAPRYADTPRYLLSTSSSTGISSGIRSSIDVSSGNSSDSSSGMSDGSSRVSSTASSRRDG